MSPNIVYQGKKLQPDLTTLKTFILELQKTPLKINSKAMQNPLDMKITGVIQNYQKHAGELKTAKWSTFLPKVTWNIVTEGPS